MKLKHSPKRKTELARSESWAVAIRERYGDSQNFLKEFNPGLQEFYADDIEHICREESIPILVRISKAYGDKTAEAFLEAQITDAAVFMGEPMENVEEKIKEIKLLARTIRTDENLRTLNLALIMLFFKRLKSGHYKIYGAITPRKVLEVMQIFYAEAKELQKHYRDIAEKEQRDRERAEHEKTAITLEQYAQNKGVDIEIIRNKLYGLL